MSCTISQGLQGYGGISARVLQHSDHLPPYCVCRRIELPAAVKPAALAAMVNILAVLPAHAEAGKIFDFNLTLPVMATEFLLCMVFLEKTWFTPVGQVTLPALFMPLLLCSCVLRRLMI